MSAPASLCDEVRRHCATIAAAARWVRVDPDAFAQAGGVAGLDPALHFLDGPAEEVARYILVLDAINFGSAWFAPPALDTDAIARRLTDHARERGGTWNAEELRGLERTAVAGVLEQDPAHALIGLYAQALNDLGRWLGERTALDVIARAGGSADRFARMLASGMRFYDDVGFYKRAQITANDLALAGVAAFADVDRLTSFADNLVPHVLRLDGVLSYDDELADRIDAGRPLPAGGAMEREVRACSVHACELIAARLGVPARVLDNWLWNRGREPPYQEQPAHRTYTVFY